MPSQAANGEIRFFKKCIQLFSMLCAMHENVILQIVCLNRIFYLLLLSFAEKVAYNVKIDLVTRIMGP